MLYNAQMMVRMFYITISTFLTLNVIYSTFLCYYASLFLALTALEENDFGRERLELTVNSY